MMLQTKETDGCMKDTIKRQGDIIFTGRHIKFKAANFRGRMRAYSQALQQHSHRYPSLKNPLDHRTGYLKQTRCCRPLAVVVGGQCGVLHGRLIMQP